MSIYFFKVEKQFGVCSAGLYTEALPPSLTHGSGDNKDAAARNALRNLFSDDVGVEELTRQAEEFKGRDLLKEMMEGALRDVIAVREDYSSLEAVAR